MKKLNFKNNWERIEKKLLRTSFVGQILLIVKVGNDILRFVPGMNRDQIIWRVLVNNKLYEGEKNNKYSAEIVHNLFSKEQFKKKYGENDWKSLYKRYNEKKIIYRNYFTRTVQIKKMLKRQTEEVLIFEEDI